MTAHDGLSDFAVPSLLALAAVQQKQDTRSALAAGGPIPTKNGLFYLYTDHLGSTTRLSTSTGSAVLGSEAYYLPFGGYRTTPTAGITDRGFTGHKHNDPLKLVYMNARYYVVGIGRFASADTIVPDPMNPQSYNRFGYVLNNPLRYTDPTGHSYVEYAGGGSDLTAAEIAALYLVAAAASNPQAIVDAVSDLQAEVEAFLNSLPSLDPDQEESRPTIPGIDILPDKDDRVYLYHYTSEEGLAGILASQHLLPSLQANRDAEWGDGQYFTDISPLDASTGSRGQLSRALYRVPFSTRRVEYFIQVDVTDLTVQQVSPVYSHTYGDRYIYLHGSTIPLSLIGRIVNWGPTPFGAQ